MPRERLQYDRRVDKVPLTWELPTLGFLGYIFVFLLLTQVARVIANLFVGDGITWPPAVKLMPSSIGILTGDAAAGLTHPPAHVASTTFLIVCLVVVELIALAVLTWLIFWALSMWGPQRMLGMATRTNAETVLGVSRLRRQAAVIRPDLYGPRSGRTNPPTQPKRPRMRTVEEFQADAWASPSTPTAPRRGEELDSTTELPVIPRSSIDPARRWT